MISAKGVFRFCFFEIACQNTLQICGLRIPNYKGDLRGFMGIERHLREFKGIVPARYAMDGFPRLGMEIQGLEGKTERRRSLLTVMKQMKIT